MISAEHISVSQTLVLALNMFKSTIGTSYRYPASTRKAIVALVKDACQKLSEIDGVDAASAAGLQSAASLLERESR